MQVVGRLAVTMELKSVLSGPVIEIEANRIRSVESQPDAKGDLQVDCLILSVLISTHTHLHGLVPYGHLIPPPAAFWPFLKEWWCPLVEEVPTAEDVESLSAYAALLHLKSGYACFCNVMEAPYAEPGLMTRDAEPIVDWMAGATALMAQLYQELMDRGAYTFLTRN